MQIVPGKTFGKLTAVRPAEEHSRKWVCLCECGNTTKSDKYALQNGSAKSCGCSRKSPEFKASVSKRNTKHGAYGTVEYAAWSGIVDRCENSNSKDWLNYGGRGIYIDRVWREDPQQFLSHMGLRPGKGFSVERLDVDGPYAPGNCIWATAQVQANNRRNTTKYTYKGQTKSLAEWAREYKLNPTTLSDRLASREDCIAEALEFNAIKQGKLLTYNGKVMSVAGWAEEMGFSRRGLAKRLETMTLEQAFNLPKRVWGL